MKVSIDGLRTNLARSYNEAVRAFDDEDRDGLREALMDLKQMIGAFMCVYSEDPKDLFSNMTDRLDSLKKPSGVEE